MSRPHTKGELAANAQQMALVLNAWVYQGIVYTPRDWEDGTSNPAPDRAVWAELTSDELHFHADVLGVLFSSKSEFGNYKYMVKQSAQPVRNASPNVLVKYKGDLVHLTDRGIEQRVAGAFVANYIPHEVIDKGEPGYEYVEELFATVAEWVGSEDQAHSLLYHLATALQSSWSAGKYVLLIGDGRNGKGVLLAMFKALLGSRNVSGVTRQHMAASKAIISSLNNKLANIVFDGPQQYVGESGPEKTLTVGEEYEVDLKYENEPFVVVTNALFVEGLNKEPKARDKSHAMNARFVRFYFPNTYADDLIFKGYMLSSRMLDALLTLLWEHWVPQHLLSEKLKATDKSLILQAEHALATSPVMSFIEHVYEGDNKYLDSLRSGTIRADFFINSMQTWMGTQGYGDRSILDVRDLVRENFEFKERKGRENGVPRTRAYIDGLKDITARAFEILEKGDKDILEGE